MNIEYLTVEGAERLRDLVLEKDGGIEGRHPGKLEANLHYLCLGMTILVNLKNLDATNKGMGIGTLSRQLQTSVHTTRK